MVLGHFVNLTFLLPQQNTKIIPQLKKYGLESQLTELSSFPLLKEILVYKMESQ